MQNIRLRRFVASLSSFRYISFSLLGQGPLPGEARAPAGLEADQGCSLAGNTAAQPLNLPSRRTRILLAAGQASDHVRKCCGRSLFGGPRGTARTAHECAHALPARKRLRAASQEVLTYACPQLPRIDLSPLR
jgi:hypothetical protein